MKGAQWRWNFRTEESIWMNFYFSRAFVVWIVIICYEMTDRTLSSSLLNSSKLTHDPLDASPLKNFVIDSRSMEL